MIDPSTPLENLFELLRVSDKYEIKCASSRIVDTIVSQMGNSKPSERTALLIFAIGASLNMKDLVQKSSRECLKYSPREIFEQDCD